MKRFVHVKVYKKPSDLYGIAIDGIEAGIGSKEECDELAKEFREDVDKALFVKAMLSPMAMEEA